MSKKRTTKDGFGGDGGGGGGGGSQKKKKADDNMGKVKREEEEVEEEEHRKMTPSEQKMAGLDKQIKELTAEIEGYKTERNKCADEKRRDELLRTITARGNNLTELLRQQNARADQGRFSFLFFCARVSFIFVFVFDSITCFGQLSN
jgi:hypothetical protein